MKSAPAPLWVLGLLLVALLLCLVLTAGDLPDRVATHFDLRGEANGWMSRSSHLWFMGLFGIAFPAFLTGMCYAARFFPMSTINIPAREYWLAPERRGKSFSFLFRHSLWLACLAECFVIGLCGSVVYANSRQPAHLSTPILLAFTAAFLTGVAVWIAVLIRRFRRTA